MSNKRKFNRNLRNVYKKWKEHEKCDRKYEKALKIKHDDDIEVEVDGESFDYKNIKRSEKNINDYSQNMVSEERKSFLPSYSSDSVNESDKIGITNEVDAFSNLICSNLINPPLSIGLFGDWGTGKSFFIQKLKHSVENKKGKYQDFYTEICQIEFNAWHYTDANLWASLANHIFEQIGEFLKLDEIEDEAEKKIQELKSNLASSIQIKSELTQQKKELEMKHSDFKDQIQELEKSKNTAMVSLKTKNSILSELENDKEIKESVNELNRTYSDICITVYNILNIYDEVKSLWYNLKKIISIIIDPRKFKGFLF